jgi:hypothetical protein
LSIRKLIDSKLFLPRHIRRRARPAHHAGQVFFNPCLLRLRAYINNPHCWAANENSYPDLSSLWLLDFPCLHCEICASIVKRLKPVHDHLDFSFERAVGLSMRPHCFDLVFYFRVFLVSFLSRSDWRRTLRFVTSAVATSACMKSGVYKDDGRVLKSSRNLCYTFSLACRLNKRSNNCCLCTRFASEQCHPELGAFQMAFIALCYIPWS